MFVYSMSSRTSFERIQQYPRHVYEHKRAIDIPMMVIGHYSNRSRNSEVTDFEGPDFARRTGCSFCKATEAISESLRDALVHLVQEKWAIEEEEELIRQNRLTRTLTLGLLGGKSRTSLRRLRKDTSLDAIEEI